jgi:hypothetical protein
VLPDLPVRTVQEMGLKELERIRLILRGGSVIEWRRLHFKTWDEVDRFLRLFQIDPTRKHDDLWVRTVLNDAVEYLRKTFNYRVADVVANPNMIHDLFLLASGEIDRKYRKIACVCSRRCVIQHRGARPAVQDRGAEAELAQMVTERVNAAMEEGKQKGLRIVEFADSSRRAVDDHQAHRQKDSTAGDLRPHALPGDRQGAGRRHPTLYFSRSACCRSNFIVPRDRQHADPLGSLAYRTKGTRGSCTSTSTTKSASWQPRAP